MKNFMITLALPIVLTSCGYGGIGAIESPAWHATASVADKKRYYTDQCLAFGFEENTTEMAKCIQTQSNTSRSRSKSALNSAFDDYNRRGSEASRPVAVLLGQRDLPWTRRPGASHRAWRRQRRVSAQHR